MKKSKTYQFLLFFNEKELKNLTNFIHSTYFNKENQVKLLFDYYLANINKNPNKADAYQYIYKDNKNVLNRLNYLNTQLLALFKDFISIENFIEKKSIYNISVLNKLGKINQKHWYRLEENKIENNRKKISKRTSVDFQKNYLFELERINFYAEQQRTETKYLENIHHNLDAYYFIEKLKATCTEINQQKLYNTESKQSFFKPLIQYIEQSKLHLEIPLLNIYFSAYKMLVENSIDYFRKLKISIEVSDIETSEIKDAFTLGLNFCIQQINSGKTSFNNEMFEMYQTGIEKEILLINGKLSSINYSNVVTIGLRLKRFDEVESFIEKNKSLLSGTEKQSYYSFNLAKVLFEKGKFQEVTALYNEKLIKEILLNIQMRILQIKAFYELGELDVCESLILSTDQLLNRKGILAYHKKVFKAFIKFSKSLVALNHFDKEMVLNLKSKIEKSDALIEKAWLVSKL